MTERIRQPLPDGETARDVKFTPQPSRPSNRFEDRHGTDDHDAHQLVHAFAGVAVSEQIDATRQDHRRGTTLRCQMRGHSEHIAS
jgi:hypothetical protein